MKNLAAITAFFIIGIAFCNRFAEASDSLRSSQKSLTYEHDVTNDETPSSSSPSRRSVSHSQSSGVRYLRSRPSLEYYMPLYYVDCDDINLLPVRLITFDIVEFDFHHPGEYVVMCGDVCNPNEDISDGAASVHYLFEWQQEATQTRTVIAGVAIKNPGFPTFIIRPDEFARLQVFADFERVLFSGDQNTPRLQIIIGSVRITQPRLITNPDFVMVISYPNGLINRIQITEFEGNLAVSIRPSDGFTPINGLLGVGNGAVLGSPTDAFGFLIDDNISVSEQCEKTKAFSERWRINDNKFSLFIRPTPIRFSAVICKGFDVTKSLQNITESIVENALGCARNETSCTSTVEINSFTFDCDSISDGKECVIIDLNIKPVGRFDVRDDLQNEIEEGGEIFNALICEPSRLSSVPTSTPSDYASASPTISPRLPDIEDVDVLIKFSAVICEGFNVKKALQDITESIVENSLSCARNETGCTSTNSTVKIIVRRFDCGFIDGFDDISDDITELCAIIDLVIDSTANEKRDQQNTKGKIVNDLQNEIEEGGEIFNALICEPSRPSSVPTSTPSQSISPSMSSSNSPSQSPTVTTKIALPLSETSPTSSQSMSITTIAIVVASSIFSLCLGILCYINFKNKNKSPDPSMWSISYVQLLEVRDQAVALFKEKGEEIDTKTLREINQSIIIPVCQSTLKSYASSKNPNGIKMNVFVSHSWDEPFIAFVESIEIAFQNSLVKPNLWICAFGLLQGTPEEIQSQLGSGETSLDQSPFVKALKKADKYLVVRNRNTDLCDRIWCICEIMYAKKFNLIPDKTLIAGPNTFSNTKISCLDAKCFDIKDKDKILKELLNTHDQSEIDEYIATFRSFSNREI